jgi:hypothetical protein
MVAQVGSELGWGGGDGGGVSDPTCFEPGEWCG